MLLAIHGGAGPILKDRFPPERQALVRDALEEAVWAGWKVLKEGNSAVDATVAAVSVLEDCPFFNAGRGSVFTRNGKNEMEACVADGRTGRFGSCSLLHHVEHPIHLAKDILLHSPFQFLAGPCAETFARERHLTLVPPSFFFTPERWKQHEETPGTKPPPEFATGLSGLVHDDGVLPVPLETVGAVALDAQGHLAAATSTGGLNNKWDGRIGDTPIPGAGSWANDGMLAISGTGNGEFFIRNCIAHDILSRIKYQNISAREAARLVVGELEPGTAGCIVLDAHVTMPMNTAGMYRGYMHEGLAEPIVNIFADEDDKL